MRMCSLFVAAVGMFSISCSLLAHADTISVSFTANGTGVKNATNAYGVTSTAFSQFDTSLGTLNSLSLMVNGIGVLSGGSNASLSVVTPGTAPLSVYFSGGGSGGSGMPFAFSASGTYLNAAGFSPFVGTGTQTLILDFTLPNGGLLTTATTTGTLAYNYTPVATAATPEPSSIALLSTGLLGIGAAFRRRSA